VFVSSCRREIGAAAFSSVVVRKGAILLTGVPRSHPGFGTGDDARFFPVGDKWHAPLSSKLRIRFGRERMRERREGGNLSVDKECESAGTFGGCFRGVGGLEGCVGKTSL